MQPKLPIRILLLCLSFTLLTAGAVLASPGGTEPAAAPDRMDASAPDAIPAALLDKQLEIDRYVFADHIADIEAQGFAVTHTGTVADYVEVGITPYSEAGADYLYALFGRDLVRVVAGQMATPLMLGNAADGDVTVQIMAATGEATDKTADDTMIITLAGAGESAPSETQPGLNQILLYALAAAGIALVAITARKLSLARR